MRGKRIAWLAWMTVLCLSLTWTPTFARSVNTAHWQNVVAPTANAHVESSLLTQNEQTILVHRMTGTSQKTIDIGLTAKEGSTSGRLTVEGCVYLNAVVDEAQVTLPANETKTIHLTLSAGSNWSSLTQAATESLIVRWVPDSAAQATLSAEIQIPLVPDPPAEETTQPDPPAEETGGEGEEDDGNANGGSGEETESGSEGGSGEETGTGEAGTGEADPSQTNTETRIQQPSSAAETPAVQPLTEENTPAALAETTNTDALIDKDKFTAKFTDEVPIALSVKAPENCQNLYLTLGDSDFPAMTRYSVGGKSVILYDGGRIVLSAEQNSVVLISLPQTTMGSEETGTAAVRIRAAAETESTIQQQSIEATKLQTALLIRPEQTMILTENQPLNMTVNAAPEMGTFVCSVYQLRKANSGSALEWKQYTSEGLGLSVTTNENQLQIAIGGQNKPPAGSYRIVMSLTFENVILWSESVSFFVQY